MKRRCLHALHWALLAWALVPRAATAMAVYDAAAVLRLAQQVLLFEQQLETLKKEYESLTGARDVVQRLLHPSRDDFDYLSGDLSEILGNTVRTTQTLGEIAARFGDQTLLLGATQLAALEKDTRERVESLRNEVMQTADLAELAFKHTSERFANLQSLADSISKTKDLKEVSELQAHIQTQLAKLQNEKNQLAALNLGQLAKDRLQVLLDREATVKYINQHDLSL